MQFIIIEWEVYNLTKDPLSLGLIGLAEIIPAISISLFAGHIADQKEKKIVCTCNYCFSVCVICFFFYYKKLCLFNLYIKTNINWYIFSSLFGRMYSCFFGPIIFSLLALIVSKELIQMLLLGVVQLGNSHQF